MTAMQDLILAVGESEAARIHKAWLWEYAEHIGKHMDAIVAEGSIPGAVAQQRFMAAALARQKQDESLSAPPQALISDAMREKAPGPGKAP